MKLAAKVNRLTILAKGGAPAGHICPNSTMAFRIRRMIMIVFLCFIMVVSYLFY